MGTFLVGGIVAVWAVLAIRHTIKNKKHGGCGCGCENCAAQCHAEKQR